MIFPVVPQFLFVKKGLFLLLMHKENRKTTMLDRIDFVCTCIQESIFPSNPASVSSTLLFPRGPSGVPGVVYVHFVSVKGKDMMATSA